ncbi:MAG: hypothetical protein ACK53V_02985, partial [Planctomycetota bacterium]
DGRLRPISSNGLPSAVVSKQFVDFGKCSVLSIHTRTQADRLNEVDPLNVVRAHGGLSANDDHHRVAAKKKHHVERA